MCNDPMPKTYLPKSLSPLGARGMTLFNTLEGKHYQCAMDNIYYSAKNFKEE